MHIDVKVNGHLYVPSSQLDYLEGMATALAIISTLKSKYQRPLWHYGTFFIYL